MISQAKLRILFRVTGPALIVSCSPSPQASNGAEARTRPSTIEAKAEPSGIAGTADVPEPFVARFRKSSEPVPNMMSTGMIKIEAGCVVADIPGTGIFTAVFPRNATFDRTGGDLVSAKFDGRTVRFGEQGLIPGGSLGTDHSLYLEQALPPSCPRQIFGLGG